MSFIVREFYLTWPISSLSRKCAVLCLLVLIPRLGHQCKFLRTTFDNPRFDPTGAVADFIAGNLTEIVFAKYLPDGFIRWHEPL